MSQRIDAGEQSGYQAPSQYYGALYQGQQGFARGAGGTFGPLFVQGNLSEHTMMRHRLILAICSLAAVVISVIVLVVALDSYYGGTYIVSALIALAMVCTTIVAINVAFNLRR
ncbi:MAG TPA: hypothetical protein VH599_09900 [Ktedonobacterales bacterium]|jgi:hypothetical protein